jgi:hypothetical protein
VFSVVFVQNAYKRSEFRCQFGSGQLRVNNAAQAREQASKEKFVVEEELEVGL